MYTTVITEGLSRTVCNDWRWTYTAKNEGVKTKKYWKWTVPGYWHLHHILSSTLQHLHVLCHRPSVAESVPKKSPYKIWVSINTNFGKLHCISSIDVLSLQKANHSLTNLSHPSQTKHSFHSLFTKVVYWLIYCSIYCSKLTVLWITVQNYLKTHILHSQIPETSK